MQSQAKRTRRLRSKRIVYALDGCVSPEFQGFEVGLERQVIVSGLDIGGETIVDGFRVFGGCASRGGHDTCRVNGVARETEVSSRGAKWRYKQLRTGCVWPKSEVFEPSGSKLRSRHIGRPGHEGPSPSGHARAMKTSRARGVLEYASLPLVVCVTTKANNSNFVPEPGSK